MKRNVIRILIAFTIINLIVLSAYKYYKNQSQLEKYASMLSENGSKLKQSKILGIGLNDLSALQGETNFQEEIEKNDKTLIVILDPTGCGSCLEENVLWNEIYEDGKINVDVIVTHNNKEETLDYAKNTPLKMPVYIDSTYQSLTRLAPETVPVKLLVDREGKILWAGYVTYSPEERKLFKKSLYNFI